MHWLGLVDRVDHVCCRYRLAAFRPLLEQAGHTLELRPLPRRWWSWLRFFQRLRRANVILQRRLLCGWQRVLLRRAARRLLFDFDDAVFLRDSYAARGLHDPRRRRRFVGLVRCADAVIAGNVFLADHAAGARRVHIIPTCVDPTRYPLAEPTRIGSGVELVWVGSSSTLQGLRAIAPLLEEIGQSLPGLHLKLICDRFLELRGLSVLPCPWAESSEAAEISRADIGISWIPDDLWSRGKCGLKVLQYMAAGLPVIANPVGVQCAMVRHGETGFLAETPAQWIEAVHRLAHDPALRRRMGRAGRRLVESHYSVTAGAARWVALLDRLREPLAAEQRIVMAESIVLVTGGVRWQIQPGLEPLFGPDGLRLNDWLAAEQARIIKHGPHRTVYHVVLPGVDFYLKHNRLADRRAWLRQLVRPSKARSEYEHTLAVAARAVPTMEPLAIGETCGGAGPRCSYLITRALPETRPLNSFLEDTLPQWPAPRRARLRQRLAVALGRLLAHMHNAGITHHDLHPGNLLLRLDANDRPALFLIDLHAIRLGAPLSWRARRANLIVLNRWFALRCERTDRLRCWLTYCDKSGLSHPQFDIRKAASALERGTLASNLRFWRGLDRRCRAANRHFRRVRGAGVTGHAAANLAAEVLAPLLVDPDAPFERSNALVLKKSASSAVVEFDLPGPEGPRRVVYKRFAVTRWSDPWTALVRPTPALRSYVMGHGLLLRCLPTPRPLAVWHRSRHGLLHEGYLITEKVPDALELRDFVDHLDTLSAVERRTLLRRLIDRVAGLIGTLHQRRLSHRDLKAANLLVSGVSTLAVGREPQVFLIDLVGVRRPLKLCRSRCLQNLARLNSSFLNHPSLTRTDRLRFLRVYLRWGLRGRIGWKRWWRQMEAATANKVRRNLRNNRPLG